MGVKGLWHIISNSGKPIALETLEHKILAIDVSIWLHQAVHGMRGLGGSSVANAHLLVLFHRICKLLFYGIKPVFVFDGGVPRLKRQTLSARRLKRDIASQKATKVRDRLLANLFKSQAVRNALGKRGPGPAEHRIAQIKKPQSDMFELPPIPEGSKFEELASACDVKAEEEDTVFTSLHDFDSKHDTFRDLPLQKKHEIMCDLETTRKENSWNTVNEMPQESNSFAKYQMERLLKRNQFQVDIDTVRTQIQKDHTAELEAQLFNELEEHVSLTHRHASEDAYSILIKTKVDQEPVKNIFAEEKVTSKKKTVSKIDFLTELSKHGIVDQDKLTNDYSSDISDEDDLIYKDSSKLEQLSFVKALDCVMDNETELSQEEIYSLIQQSKQEAISDTPKVFNIDRPSTSKQSEVWQVSSSSDDDDFIDDDTETDTNTSPLQSSSGSISSTSNIDAIRQSKSSSLFLKIIQQKLDEVAPPPSTNSRHGVSPQKSKRPETLEISFDRNSFIPIDEDIFSDIFSSHSHKIQSIADGRAVAQVDHKNLPLSPTVKEQLSQGIGYVKSKSAETSPSKGGILSRKSQLSKYPTTDTMSHIDLEKELNSEKSDEYITDSDNSSGLDCVSDNDATQSDINTLVQSDLRSKTITRVPSESDIIMERMSNSNNMDTDVITKNMHGHMSVESEINNGDVAANSQAVDVDNKSISNTNSHKLMSSRPKIAKISPPKYSELELLNMETNLASEQSTLVSEVQKLDRVAASISEQKFEEAKELLRLFGIPYMVAPMEAEAQCAFLNSINLTQGTITDDSDVFLFGGRQVYKNFFNQMRQVEVFDSVNVDRLYGLSRIKMIQLALLTGSDYTIGIDSVGAVMAMELLSEYPSDGLGGLLTLKKNWRSLQNNVLSGARNKLSHLHFPEAFPSKEIVDAYLKPDVDTCTEKFSWGLPNVEALTKFTADKFGWNVSKTSDILVPVLKKIDNKSSQRRLDSYFSSITLTKQPIIKSKRLREAIKLSADELALPYLVSSEGDQSKSRKKTILIPDPPRPNESKTDKSKRKNPVHSAGPLKKSKPDSLTGNEINNTTTAEPLTKEQKKIRNFKSLLKPTKIPQVEKEKREKAAKLQKAISILKKSKK